MFYQFSRIFSFGAARQQFIEENFSVSSVRIVRIRRDCVARIQHYRTSAFFLILLLYWALAFISLHSKFEFMCASLSPQCVKIAISLDNMTRFCAKLAIREARLSTIGYWSSLWQNRWASEWTAVNGQCIECCVYNYISPANDTLAQTIRTVDKSTRPRPGDESDRKFYRTGWFSVRASRSLWFWPRSVFP